MIFMKICFKKDYKDNSKDGNRGYKMKLSYLISIFLYNLLTIVEVIHSDKLLPNSV